MKRSKLDRLENERRIREYNERIKTSKEIYKNKFKNKYKTKNKNLLEEIE